MCSVWLLFESGEEEEEEDEGERERSFCILFHKVAVS